MSVAIFEEITFCPGMHGHSFFFLNKHVGNRQISDLEERLASNAFLENCHFVSSDKKEALV